MDQGNSQLDFLDVLDRRDDVDAITLRELKSLMYNLRYLKVNTILARGLVKSGVEREVDLAIYITAFMQHMLTESQTELQKYIKSCQHVTINTYHPITKEELYDKVAQIHIPTMQSNLYGIILAREGLIEAINNIKDDLQIRTEKDGF